MRVLSVTFAIALCGTSAIAFAGVQKSSVKPKGNPADWASDEDAGGSVLQNGGGTATVAYDITSAGRVVNCRVIKPAPNPSIGDYICTLVVRRGRYVPGSSGTGTYTMGWLT